MQEGTSSPAEGSEGAAKVPETGAEERASQGDGEGATPLRLPVRALWCLPAATAFVAVFEAGTQASNQGMGVTSLILSAATGALVGLWPALFLVLAALIAGKIGERWSPLERLLEAVDQGLQAPPAALTGLAVALAAVTAAVGPSVRRIIAVSQANPVDYPETQGRLWTAGLLAAIPAAFFALALLARVVEWALSREGALARPGLSRWLLRGALLTIAALTVAHLVSGPFFVYLGARVAFGLLAVLAVFAAAWLPRRTPTQGSTVRMLGQLGGLALVVVLGVVGLRSPASRALLLHDTRVFPHYLDVALGGFDTDDDGSYPPWLGGADCDNLDPERSPWRVEIPDSGVDEDCDGVDLEAVEVAAPPAMPEPGTLERPPIFLISIDTLRLDRMDIGGYARVTMPRVAAFAEQGRWYANARAPANHTFYSMVSLLAGQNTERLLIPGERHEAGRMAFRTWLPATLGSLGYATVAINPPLILEGKLPASELRFEHIEVGRYDFAGKNRGTTARQVVDDVERILGQDPGDRPVFAWVHFMDPHASHEAPVKFSGDPDPVRDAYDNELLWVDLHLSRLLAFIDARYPDALVILTSDHGEEFGERGNYGHGFSLADSELRVPLAIAGPGVPPGVESRPVSLVGVAPTVLELLGVPVPAGMSPSRLLELPAEGAASSLSANPAYLWNEPRMELALVAEHEGATWKLVHGRMRNTWLLYDLDADPAETRNLVGERPAVLEAMQERLAEAVAAERSDPGARID